MKRIQSECNETGTYNINEISLLYFVDEQYVFGYVIENPAYGHKDIN